MATAKGLIVVLSGPSGVGKDTLISSWLKMNRSLRRIVTFTTRKPRPDERMGVDYHFVSSEEFQQRDNRNGFLESKQVHGNRYGTPLDDIEGYLESGIDALLKIDVQGAFEVKQKRPETVMLFVQPPSFATLEERLRKRGTDTPEEISRRLDTAKKEMAVIHDYDYLVTNDEVDRAVRQLQAILVAEHSRVGRVAIST